VHILQAINDKKVFGQHFRGDTWAPWFAFLAALFELPMTPEQLAIYQQCTGRNAPPTAPCREAWLVCGRRSGKSFILACIAVFLAVFKDWRPFLGPGELATIMIIARDRKQARVILRFCLGLLKATPMLRKQIESVTQESISLRNNLIIEVHTASYRSTRGYTICAALLDEQAFWPSDESSAAPDVEVLAAVRPGMATIPQSILLAASSPHARRGAMWEAYQKHFGKDGDPILVWQAATRTMNATVPQSTVDEALAADPALNTAEYLAQFRTDVEAFVTREAVLACVSPCVFERPKEHYKTYYATCDPSGGSADPMTLAIGHVEGKIIMVDALREVRPPFNPTSVVEEFAAACRSYGVSKIVGDRYAGQWPVEAFGKVGIRYEHTPKVKNDHYIDVLPLLNSRRIALLDNGRLINQLVSLERQINRGGRDTIDHPRNQHDDLANAVAILASVCTQYGGYSLDAFQPGFRDLDAKPAPQQPPAANQGVSAAYYKALERESWERYCRAQREAMLRGRS
jgi:hypothetical protein